MIKSYFVVMLLIAMVSNTDNFGVGISYGTRKILIPFTSNIIIALITGIGTFISMIIGVEVSNFIQAKYSVILGAVIILIVGMFIFIKESVNALKKREEPLEEEMKVDAYRLWNIGKIPKILQNPFLADWDFSGYISISESLILGFALALNNMANGIGAGLAGLNPLITAMFAFFISLLGIWLGIKLGHDYVYSILGKLAAPLSGVILILIGLYELFL